MKRIIAIGVLFTAWLVYRFFLDQYDPKVIADKRVLVTGASSGIGEHLAYEYSKLGARVFITARRVSLLQTVAEKCKELGAKQVEVYAGDMGLTEDREAVVREVEKRLGGLDHLILNHGILIKDWWTGSKQNMTALWNILNVNFVSYVDLASLALPMLTKSRGNIGVVSSTSGIISVAQMTHYSACKFALHGFFNGFRQELMMKELDVSVTMCVIAFVVTPMTSFANISVTAEGPTYLHLIHRAVCESPRDTATAIIRSVAMKQYEFYFGNLAYFAVYFHRLFPSLSENLNSKFITLFPIVL